MIKVRLLDESGKEFYGNGWPRGGVEYSNTIAIRARGGAIRCKSLQYYWTLNGTILQTIHANELHKADHGTDFQIIHS